MAWKFLYYYLLALSSISHTKHIYSLQFNLNEIYSLKVLSIKDDIKNSISNQLFDNGSNNYIVAPKHFRRYIDRMTKRKCHDLEEARIKHRQLDNEINSLLQLTLTHNHHMSIYDPQVNLKLQKSKTKQRFEPLTTSSAPVQISSSFPISTSVIHDKIKYLKSKKLRYKDLIVKLMKTQQNKVEYDDITKENFQSKEITESSYSKNNASTNIIELGVGGFGKILFGTCLSTQKEIAIKITKPCDAVNLANEYAILQKLYINQEQGFPHVFYFGKQDILTVGEHVVMVMDVLGPSLEKLLFSTCLGVKGFSEATVLRLALQMVSRLESLAKHNIVHGDIQPGNFLMGKNEGDQHTVYLIDFGLSFMSTTSTHSDSVPLTLTDTQTTTNAATAINRSVSNNNNSNATIQSTINLNSNNNFSAASVTMTSPSSTVVKKHTIAEPVPSGTVSSQTEATVTATTSNTTMTGTNKIFGTLSFASSRSLNGQTPRTRDDLEALAFTLAYLYQGRLPWSEDSYFNSFCKNKTNYSPNTDVSDNISCSSSLTSTTAGVTASPELLLELDWIRHVSSYKESMDPYSLCGLEHKNNIIAITIGNILKHARSLEYTEKPNFTYIYQLLNDALALSIKNENDPIARSSHNNINNINNNNNNNMETTDSSNTDINNNSSSLINSSRHSQSWHRDLFDWEQEGIHWSKIDGSIIHDY